MKQFTGISILVFTLIICSTHVCAGDGEVYTWTDENGVVHYGDLPPEGQPSRNVDVPKAYYPGSDTRAAEMDSPAPETEQLSPADQVRANMAAKRERKLALDRETEANCVRARQQLEGIEPYRRIRYVNEAGEEVWMDDDERVGLVEQAKDFIAQNCD